MSFLEILELAKIAKKYYQACGDYVYEMKRLLLHGTNGFLMVGFVAGYSVFTDWQAWVMIFWFVLSLSLAESGWIKE